MDSDEPEEIENSSKNEGKRTLKTAYHMLRQEALRQFAKMHRNDPDWENPSSENHTLVLITSLDSLYFLTVNHSQSHLNLKI